MRFLFSRIKDVPKNEIKETLKKLDSENSYKKDIGEHLILLLDKFEVVHKADLLGKAFKMYLQRTAFLR